MTSPAVLTIELRQILVHGLFHADPHPGNVFVLPGHVIALVDFGIVGRVSRRLRERLAEVILAVKHRDAEGLAEIVVAVATPLQPVEMPELVRDIEEMLDVYSDVPIGELSLKQLFSSITAAMSRHRLKLPADLLLLIKSVATIESVGSRLDPQFKIVDHAAPLVTAQIGLQVQFVHRNLDFFIREMDRSSNRLAFAIVIAAIVIASAIVVHAPAGPQVLGSPLLGVGGFIAAAVLGLGLVAGILRSGRL